MEDKIDVHNMEGRYEAGIKRLERDPNMSPEDKAAVQRFVWDCKMGKTLVGKTRKKVGKARILKYVESLRRITKWLNKPLGQATPWDIEKLVCEIDENIHKNGEKKYSEDTKADFKKALKKYYKWLGKPELVEFISFATPPKDKPALTREEAETMINSTPSRLLKAAVIVLFDGGLRIEEFLNLRMKDLTKERYNNDASCFWIDVRISKTFARKIPLPLSTKPLEDWLAEHPEPKNTEAQLFPIRYSLFRKRLGNLGQEAIRKKVHPHMLRHSSATYWAAKMNRYQLCAKYGWAFSSDMPDRYIKRKGIIFSQIAEKGDTDQTYRLEKENRQMKDRMEDLERDYEKLKKAFEVIMPVLQEKMEEPGFRRRLYERKKEEFLAGQLEELDKSIGRLCPSEESSGPSC